MRLRVGAAALLLAGCPEVDRSEPVAKAPSRAEQALRSAGFTDIRLSGTPYFTCADDDSLFMSSNFRAKNSTGELVGGAVCCGFVKGCTVRY